MKVLTAYEEMMQQTFYVVWQTKVVRMTDARIIKHFCEAVHPVKKIFYTLPNSNLGVVGILFYQHLIPRYQPTSR